MFGESDSESPREPSPWDSFNYTAAHNRVLQLVPENEEGNVEYKLHLLSPSPSRFTRLVTQLKWRLLEGGGQAYYELGISDSGVLVGLSKHEMEDTLATLEEMAAEIGAGVIIVKEIQVSIDASRVGRQMSFMSEVSKTQTSTTVEAGLETINLATTDVHLEMFSIHQGDLSSSSSGAGTVDLKIARVYKPRPFRRRLANTVQAHSDRRRGKGKGKGPNHLLAHPCAQPSSHSDHHINHSRHNHPVSMGPHAHLTSECKQYKRHAARDKHDPKPNPLLHVPTICIDVEEVNRLDSHLSSLPPEILTCGHEDNLDSFIHAPLDKSCSVSPMESYRQSEHITNELDDIDLQSTAEIERTSLDTLLIVEALVVRKMLLEEAFLDFEGFSMC